MENINVKKLFIIFLKRIIKYMVIIILFILISIPLIMTSYDLAKKSVINKTTIKVNEGINNLDMEIEKIRVISSIIKDEADYKKLITINGEPKNEYYLAFKNIREKLGRLCVTQDLLVESHILFKNSPIFISNYFSSDDYNKIYPELIKFENQTTDSWRDNLFEQNTEVNINPVQKYYSTYYSPIEFNAITINIKNLSAYNYEKNSVFSYIFNEDDIIDKMMYKDEQDKNIYYLVDKNNNVISSKNFNGNLDNVSHDYKNFVIIESDTIKYGLTAYIGIPANIFESNITSLIKIVVFYSIFSIVIAFMLAIFFSVRETITLKGLIELVNKSSTLVFDSKNEYNYINNGIKQLNNINENQIYEIATLDKVVKERLLSDLFIHGVYSEKEENDIAKFFNDSFDFFCTAIIKVRLSEDNNNAILANKLQKINLSLHTVLKNKNFSVSKGLDEIAVLIIIELNDNTDMKIIKDNLIRLIDFVCENETYPTSINIGLSRMSSGIKTVRESYLQAKDALSFNNNIDTSGLLLYDTARSIYHKKTIDSAVLTKCYDLILNGEVEIVRKIFDSIILTVEKYTNQEREKQQLFFSIREPLYNALLEVNKTELEKNVTLKLPQFNHNVSLLELILELKEFAINLCWFVQSFKDNSNDKRKKELMQFIENNYSDFNLSAYTISSFLLISEKYLFSIVKELTGSTLSKLIEDVRIEKAEQLLLETDYPNKKIASMCGFGSDNTFYRAFAKKNFVTPTVWKKNKIV